MQKIKAGIIGPGFIGPAHIEAIRRLGFVEVVALAESDKAAAEKKAAIYGSSSADSCTDTASGFSDNTCLPDNMISLLI